MQNPLAAVFLRIVVAALSILRCASTLDADPPTPVPSAPAPVTIGLVAKAFPLSGDWVHQNEFEREVLFASSPAPKYPAAVAIVVPRAAKYRLWVAARDFPESKPGTRTFSVSIGGHRSDVRFGRSGKEGYTFEDGGWLELPAGPALVVLDQAAAFARFYRLILTTDDGLKPTLVGAASVVPPAKLYPLPAEDTAETAGSNWKLDPAATPQATLANDRVRFDFLPAQRGEQATLGLAVHLNTPHGWQAVSIDPEAEGYFVNQAPADTSLNFDGFYPLWKKTDVKPVSVDLGGVHLTTIAGYSTHAQTTVGTRTRFIPRSTVAEGDTVRIEFYPSPAGQLRATWRLPAGQPYADVELSFTGAGGGQSVLSYELFFRRDLDQVAELLLPMMYQRKRLPEFDVTLLSNTTPTPLSLVQPRVESPVSLALVADPRDIPFAWPDGRVAPYALSIRGPGGTVQPAISGPVLGTPAAKAGSKEVRLRYKVLVESGNWYAGFRCAVDQIFGVTDYRQSTRTSLSEAVLNMIDLYLDDDHGGWWPRADAPYQIESKNGSTHASPLLPLSLYRLTGDKRLLECRALPTMGFMLSRDGAHFSPVPEDTGNYPAGSMNGPVKMFGTSTYAGLWELSGRRTPAFWEIANPPGEPRPTAGYVHDAAFGGYLARYRLTGQSADLDRACTMADAYIRAAVDTPPHKDLGPQPFFYYSFVPDWQGLLWMYEATGKQRYLDAAASGARQLMTGLWSQPVIPPNDITVHPTGEYVDQTEHMWWKGPVTFRQGWPRKPNDTPAHQAPAWIVSNVGLGFEQPITYRSSGTGRLIWQSIFSPAFLRLSRYTHDAAFMTSARNAVVGRWGNYPGYYVTGLTDLPQDPRYPFTGPDVTDFYYHHIEPQLAWTIDYLVSEAETLSDGAISFPALRQYGYVYFDFRIFGHAPGKIYGQPASLLFHRDVVQSDNPQINVSLARGEGKLFAVLTNQSHQPQDVTLTPGSLLHFDGSGGAQATLRSGAAEPVPLTPGDGGSLKVSVPSRGLAVVTLSGASIDLPAPPQPGAERRGASSILSLPGPVATTHAAALQVDPGEWYAYVWSTATPQDAHSATLRYQIAGQSQAATKSEYPYEFFIPVKDEHQAMVFQLQLKRPDGKTSSSPEATLQLP